MVLIAGFWSASALPIPRLRPLSRTFSRMGKCGIYMCATPRLDATSLGSSDQSAAGDLDPAGAAAGGGELVNFRLRGYLFQRELFPRLLFLLDCGLSIPAGQTVLRHVFAAPGSAAIEPVVRGAVRVYSQFVAPAGGNVLEAFDSDIGNTCFVLIVVDEKRKLAAGGGKMGLQNNLLLRVGGAV